MKRITTPLVENKTETFLSFKLTYWATKEFNTKLKFRLLSSSRFWHGTHRSTTRTASQQSQRLPRRTRTKIICSCFRASEQHKCSSALPFRARFDSTDPRLQGHYHGVCGYCLGHVADSPRYSVQCGKFSREARRAAGQPHGALGCLLCSCRLKTLAGKYIGNAKYYLTLSGFFTLPTVQIWTKTYQWPI